MLWDDQNLYVGFWLEDRDVCGVQGEDPLSVRQDNNVGVLLVGRGAYYELAVNPLGATSEMFHIWKDAYQRGGRYDVPEFDLAVHRPEVLGGGSNSDYRAMRWAFSHWRFPRLQVGVQIEGTLNKRDDIDRGWSVELAFPWEGLKRLADAQSLPPAAGDVWRVGLVAASDHRPARQSAAGFVDLAAPRRKQPARARDASRGGILSRTAGRVFREFGVGVRLRSCLKTRLGSR